MKSVLLAKDGNIIGAGVAFCIVTDHNKENYKYISISANPTTSIFACKRGLTPSRHIDNQELASIFHGSELLREHHLNTEDFLSALDERLKAKLS